MPPLRPCPHCGHHALTEATTCPHCEHVLPAAGTPGIPRSAAALALGLALASCKTDDPTYTHGSMYVDYGAGVTDADTDSDTDSDADTDTDADSDADTDPTGDTGGTTP
ncbi:MAG: hypothetical protein KC621_25150 [Myxococcales bacterium]|nr:hypothetical protein [Myxococcales bacterium]